MLFSTPAGGNTRVSAALSDDELNGGEGYDGMWAQASQLKK